MFGLIRIPELLIVSVIALVVFDPANFPDFRKSLGLSIRGSMKTLTDFVRWAIERSGSSTPVNQAFTFQFVP
ncbi:MAG TPA: twin-arginine translocase TatA/TatE family subunit [Candidatus Binatia bacterium]